MVQMIAVLELPPRAGARNLVSLLSRITPRRLCFSDGLAGSDIDGRLSRRARKFRGDWSMFSCCACLAASGIAANTRGDNIFGSEKRGDSAKDPLREKEGLGCEGGDGI